MRSQRRHDAAFLLPWMVGFALLLLVPTISCLAMALTRSDRQLTLGDRSWVGLDHFRTILRIDKHHTPSPQDPWYWSWLGGRPGDEAFYASLYNSLWYSFFAIPLGLVTSLGVALLLGRRLPGMPVARAMVYLPHLLGGVATLVIWSWLLNPRFGWINEGIRMVYALLEPMAGLLGLGDSADWPVPGWLYSPTWSKPALVLIHVWTMGGSMLVFLAAIVRVPMTLYEAAALDGASSRRRFYHVTLPQITPAILFNTVVALTFTMQSFNESYLLETREQRGAMVFSVLNLYRTAFEPPYRLGYACAQGLILWALLALLMVPLWITARRWVFYAGKA